MFNLLYFLALLLTLNSVVNSIETDNQCGNTCTTTSPKLITFVCTLDTGHVRALLPLVEHMAKLGKYRVQFAVPEDVQHLVNKTGAQILPFGRVPGGVAWENQETSKAFDPSLSILSALDAHARNFRVRAELMIKPMLEAFEKDRPDLVVCDMITTACWDITEKLGIPMVFFGATAMPLSDPGWRFPFGLYHPGDGYIPYQGMEMALGNTMDLKTRVLNFLWKLIIAPLPPRIFIFFSLVFFLT
eukprot:TRINITY_DN7716_c0_g1_i6.p1 TRINITY_DN7716_c0_g1~~TRINITY_DN7716_c0_g1_i6.p1  ORF type:complete len:244 (+),score=34.69 TRINITY_DN7716_c0_g1_i6:876-1607(+)